MDFIYFTYLFIYFFFLFIYFFVCVCGFYRCVNSGKSLTNWVKPEELYVKFVSDSLEFTNR